MPQRFDTLSQLLAHGFDDVIDVRSPAEFAEDHIPGALNLPALSNDQREEVGTIYVQVSPFDARKLGAAMVARNVAGHLETVLQDRDGSWRPLVYCWRGGQRSGSVATILKAVGWRAETIESGYQSFRRLVHAALYDTVLPHRLILLDGNTGTAKTDILHRLTRLGIQTLDLEGMARHRGSLLGGVPEGQPNQKAFETGIACRLAELDPARPVIVEAESSKIGDLIIPPAIWAAMKDARRIEVSAPLVARADYLVDAYADAIANPDLLTERLSILRRHRGGEVVEHWLDLLAQGAHRRLAEALMRDHYDPAYAKSRAAHSPDFIETFEAAALHDADREALAVRIAGLVDGFSSG